MIWAFQIWAAFDSARNWLSLAGLWILVFYRWRETRGGEPS